MKKLDKWETKVRKARAWSLNYKNYRFELSKLAIEACEIMKGGRLSNTEWSIARFAKDIEMQPKTLNEWVAIYKNVVLKLPASIQSKLKKLPFDLLRRTKDKVRQNASPKEVRRVFLEQRGLDPDVLKFIKYKKHLLSVLYNAQKPILMKNIPIELVNEIIKITGMINTFLRKELEFREKFNKQRKLK